MADGGRIRSAFGLGLAAYSVLLLAGCLAGLALVRTGEVRLGGGPAQHKLAWPVVLVGAAGALALILLAGALSEYGATYGAVLPVQWAAVLAVLVPAGAAVAVPRQFGVSVLVSWIGTAAAIGWYYSWLLEKETDLGSTLIPVLGATLLALLVLAVLMARAAPATGEDGATA